MEAIARRAAILRPGSWDTCFVACMFRAAWENAGKDPEDYPTESAVLVSMDPEYRENFVRERMSRLLYLDGPVEAKLPDEFLELVEAIRLGLGYTPEVLKAAEDVFEARYRAPDPDTLKERTLGAFFVLGKADGMTEEEIRRAVRPLLRYVQKAQPKRRRSRLRSIAECFDPVSSYLEGLGECFRGLAESTSEIAEAIKAFTERAEGTIDEILEEADKELLRKICEEHGADPELVKIAIRFRYPVRVTYCGPGETIAGSVEWRTEDLDEPFSALSEIWGTNESEEIQNRRIEVYEEAGPITEAQIEEILPSFRRLRFDCSTWDPPIAIIQGPPKNPESSGLSIPFRISQHDIVNLS